MYIWWCFMYKYFIIIVFIPSELTAKHRSLLFALIIAVLCHPPPRRSCFSDDIVRPSGRWSDPIGHCLVARLGHHSVTALLYSLSFRLAKCLAHLHFNLEIRLSTLSTFIIRHISTFCTRFTREMPNIQRSIALCAT